MPSTVATISSSNGVRPGLIRKRSLAAVRLRWKVTRPMLSVAGAAEDAVSVNVLERGLTRGGIASFRYGSATGVTVTITLADAEPAASVATRRIRLRPGGRGAAVNVVPVPSRNGPSNQRRLRPPRPRSNWSNAVPLSTSRASPPTRVRGPGAWIVTIGGVPSAVNPADTATVSLNPSLTRTRTRARLEATK